MKLSEVQQILNANVLIGEGRMETQVNSACGCDLMSDVLAYVKDQALLLTGLVNTQVIRTAEMMDIRAIVFVRGKNPPRELLELADEEGITVMNTQLPLYTACGRLYEKGLVGKGE